MAYVTADEIVSRLGSATALQLTTDTGSSPDTAMITEIISQVEGRVDSHLRARVASPITQAAHPNTYAAVRGAVIDMVIFHLAGRRPPVSEGWQKANEKAIRWLEKLAAGDVDLPDAGLNEPNFEWGSEDQNAADWR